jgi:hypothetical protein
MRSYVALFHIVTIIAVTAVCSATPTTASVGELYRFNEGAGILSVIGGGRPPAAVQRPAQARLLAERAAIIDAYGAAARLLSEAIPQAVSGENSYSVFFRGGTVKQSDVASDGSVKVELEIPVSPELAGRVRDVLRERELLESRAEERVGSSYEQFVTRHRVRWPRSITHREWINRYQSGSWIPYTQSSGSGDGPDSGRCLHPER